MLSSSPVSTKSIVFLLGLLYLQARATHAATSTSAGFPQDVFAKPAFEVKLGGIGKGEPTLPIKYSDAINILEQQQASSSSSSSTSSQVVPPHSTLISSLEVAGLSRSQSSSQQEDAPQPVLWTLQRISQNDFQLCSIPDFSYASSSRDTSNRHSSSFAASSRPRHELIRSAQALLDPLKKVCLYHTTDWFTYSFCHGREIRQFRQLGTQTAAQKAFKAAGGGEAGKKAAIEAAEKISKLQHPIADPEYPAFILGRWTRQNEDIVGDDQSHQRPQQQPLANQPESHESATGVAVASKRGLPSLINSAGLDLVEQVQFGDWDEEELFAAEAKALAQFKGSNSDKAVEAARDASSTTGNESQRHRYLTQRWTNGTMCDMNHQPRTVEVQFHCSNRKPLEDRIVMFKETTICNYVLVIETPRLCADPAFGSEKEEAPLPIQCHSVVTDDYAGPTVGDPDKIMQPSLSGADDGARAQRSDSDSTKSDSDESSQQATASSAEGAQEATTTSHTFGDPSRYGSVHDDYYDEALGGPGALYQLFHDGHDVHDHDHHHGHDHVHDDPHVGDEHEEQEIVVELSLDENGKLHVNKLADEPTSDGSKEPLRRDGGKRRNDDDDSGNLELQLEIDDLMSVLRGEEDGNLQKKLADKIAEVINTQMQHQLDTSSRTDRGDDRGKKQKQQQQQPQALRMAKVGDSLSERVKRFYEEKQRKKDNKAPALEEHLEL